MLCYMSNLIKIYVYCKCMVVSSYLTLRGVLIGLAGGCSGEANRVVDGPDHDWPVGCALRCFDTSCWLLEGVYQVEPSVQDGMFWED